MKKIFILIFCMRVACALHAQGAIYEIDPVAKDSFYLVETITGQVTPDFPRPQTTVTNILYRSPDELLKLVSDLKKKADENEVQAKKLALEAKQGREMAEKIDAAMNRQKSFFFEKAKPEIAKKDKP